MIPSTKPKVGNFTVRGRAHRVLKTLSVGQPVHVRDLMDAAGVPPDPAPENKRKKFWALMESLQRDGLVARNRPGPFFMLARGETLLAQLEAAGPYDHRRDVPLGREIEDARHGRF